MLAELASDLQLLSVIPKNCPQTVSRWKINATILECVLGLDLVFRSMPPRFGWPSVFNLKKNHLILHNFSTIMDCFHGMHLFITFNEKLSRVLCLMKFVNFSHAQSCCVLPVNLYRLFPRFRPWLTSCVIVNLPLIGFHLCSPLLSV